jgi:HlyD family secretion protein
MLVSVGATGSIVPKQEVNLSFDLPGRVIKVWVESGDEVMAGDELARLDNTNLVFRTEQAEAALVAAQAQLDQLKAGPREEEVAAGEASLKAAQANVDSAYANLSELVGGPDEHQIAAAEANLDAAEASLWLSTVQRDQIVEGASAAEIAAAEAELASARRQQKIARDALDTTRDSGDMAEEHARYNLFAADEAVKAAQTQLDHLLAGPTQSQLDTGDANLAVVAAQRDAAQAQLAQLKSGTRAGQLEAARANVAAMTAQRDAAQAQLDMLRAGASVHQIAAAQANVDQAQVTLDAARAEMDKTMLVAPFAGVVTAVNVQVAQVTPINLSALTLADTSELHIVVGVDEIDVARITESQSVTISVDALPGVPFSGYVERIAPAASQLGGVVVYDVTVVLDKTDQPLRAGMSAKADIIVEEREDVLLVPNWAIRIDRGNGRTSVNLLRGGIVEDVEVDIGVRGEDVSQVLSGLEAGDVVVAGEVVGIRDLLERGQ